jgi:hypothetical protein
MIFLVEAPFIKFIGNFPLPWLSEGIGNKIDLAIFNMALETSSCVVAFVVLNTLEHSPSFPYFPRISRYTPRTPGLVWGLFMWI